MNMIHPQDLTDLAKALSERICDSKFILDDENHAQAEQLISLTQIAELKAIRKHCCSLSIGVMCGHDQTAVMPLVGLNFPSLKVACEKAHESAATRSTVGGSICNAAMDEYLYPVLLSADARAAVMDDQRKLDKIHVEKVMDTDGCLTLAPNQVITDFVLPIPLLPLETHTAFVVLPGDNPLILAPFVRMEEEDISHARFVLGGITKRAYRVDAAEEYLLGKLPEDIDAAELTRIVLDEISAHGCAYDAEAVRALVDEALEQMEF